jgi:NAD(P)-dependent dehydrogenase (short-subunit alcohol dehydrogenase family)
MSFEGRNVVVIGATGVVGSGVVRKYLDAGARVVGVSRSGEKLEMLAATLKLQKDEPFTRVVGSFASEAEASSTKEAIARALGGSTPDHVVSAQGFVTVAKAPTETTLATVEQAFRDGLHNNFLAAKVLLPLMKDREDRRSPS